MRKLKYCFSILLLVGCQTSVEKSFHDLNEAFTAWYYKFHPVESTRYGMTDKNGFFMSINIEQNEEYIADISRFIIELSQIDPTKLSSSNRVDYEILASKLEEMKYFMLEIRPWEWNPSWILREIYDGLFLISESQDIEMEHRVDIVKKRLNLIPEKLKESKLLISSYSKLHFEHGELIIDDVIRLLDDLPLKLNSDNMTLDEIDLSIIQSKAALLDYGEWLKEKNMNLSIFNFSSDLNLMNAFPIFIGNKYLAKNVYRLANKKINPIQNELFKKTLPIYLMENDEPVWLDRDDTLEVIHWTIDHINNKPENQVSHSGILTYFYESISAIEKFIYSKNVMDINTRKRIKLVYFPRYFHSSRNAEIFGEHPHKINSEIIYYINSDNEKNDLFPLIKQEIDLLNAKNITPGKTIQIAHSQKNAFSTRYMFPDLINQKGWEHYSVRMLLEQEYASDDETYEILLLKDELKTICMGYVEGQYYSGKINKKQAISLLRSEAFLSYKEATGLIDEIEKELFSGTYSFIGMVEMESLHREYKQKMKANYNVHDFHEAFLKHGAIPFNYLKKEILSP